MARTFWRRLLGTYYEVSCYVVLTSRRLLVLRTKHGWSTMTLEGVDETRVESITRVTKLGMLRNYMITFHLVGGERDTFSVVLSLFNDVEGQRAFIYEMPDRFNSGQPPRE